MSKQMTNEELKYRIELLEKDLKKYQKNEALFSKVFFSSPFSMVITKLADGTCVEINNKFSQVFGYTRRESIGRTSTEIGFWPDPKDREQVVQLLSKNRSVKDLVIKFLDRSGTIRVGKISLEIIVYQDNDCIITTIDDVTKTIKIQEALEKSEKKFLKLFQTNSVAISISRVKDGLILDMNDAFEKIFGWKKEEAIGRTSIELGLWGDKKNRQDFVELVAKKRLLQNHELVVMTKQGNPLYVLVSLNQIEMDGEMCFLSTAVNISARKKVEIALQESEEKYRSMMESMEESAYICSPDFHIEYMNPAMIKRTGHNAIDGTCHKVMHGFDEKCPWCVFDKILKGELINHEIVSPKDNRTYNVSNSPIFHTDGSVSKLTVYRDITELKKMEAQLRQSQKMESIGVLAGGIAHDFNNILFPIMGHTKMLIEDIPEGSPFQENLQEIYTASLRAKDLVKQILTFSRQKNIGLKPINIQPIIKEAIKLVRSTIPTTINIKPYIKTDCGIIKADPIQIHQIMMNLSTNAYQAMEETGGDLIVRLEKIKVNKSDIEIPDMAPGVYNSLIISDTGKGMDKKVVEKIFDPFFTTKVNGKGTGMGLSVVHGIVKNMEGFIKVNSQPDKGTEFHIYLPVVNNHSEMQKIHQMKQPIQGGIEQILLVDDEKSVALIVKQMLERLGYQVTSHTNSIEALETFRAAPDNFDLVISDFTMPDIPGDKLAFEMAKIRPDIPILLCTGFSETLTEEKAASMGIKGFLMKPILMRDLSEKIREILN